MTVNKIDKDSIAFIYLTILFIIAIIYGFSVIPNPQMQRDLNFDNQRIQDILTLQYAINNYYTDKKVLPQTLTEVINSKSYYGKKNIADPLTKKSYEYSIKSNQSYQLCAEFITDSEDIKKYNTSYTDNYYSYPQSYYGSSADEHKHRKGHYCFDESVYNSFDKYPTPTIYCLGSCPDQKPTAVPTATITPNSLEFITPTLTPKKLK